MVELKKLTTSRTNKNFDKLRPGFKVGFLQMMLRRDLFDSFTVQPLLPHSRLLKMALSRESSPMQYEIQRQRYVMALDVPQEEFNKLVALRVEGPTWKTMISLCQAGKAHKAFADHELVKVVVGCVSHDPDDAHDLEKLRPYDDKCIQSRQGSRGCVLSLLIARLADEELAALSRMRRGAFQNSDLVIVIRAYAERNRQFIFIGFTMLLVTLVYYYTRHCGSQDDVT
eukprot:scaffold210296_cov52-Attheya_sp.AAC.2